MAIRMNRKKTKKKKSREFYVIFPRDHSREMNYHMRPVE